MILYVLQHSRELNNDCEEIKLIGVFSSMSCAMDAQKKLGNQPGFSDYEEGFSIDKYEVDRVYWEEGFHTA